MELRPILSTLLRSKVGLILIGAQIALTLAIVCNALFIIKQRFELMGRPSGVNESDTFMIASMGFGTGFNVDTMIRTDLDLLRSLPGIVDATPVNSVPLSQGGWSEGVKLDRAQATSTTGAAIYFVDDHGLAAFDIDLVAGRNFKPEEVAMRPQRSNEWPPGVLITQMLAERLFPGESAVGKQFWLNVEAAPLTVLGVVDRMQMPWPRAGSRSGDVNLVEYSILVPQYAAGTGYSYFIRAEPGRRDELMAVVEAKLGESNRSRLVENLRSMQEVRAAAYRQDRAMTLILGGVIAALLGVTALGIVGMASFWVGQRTRQIGTRRALGATRFDILRYFLTENFIITTIGLVVGVVLTYGFNLWLMANHRSPPLPWFYVPVGIVCLWLLGQVAVLGPATRASRVPPAVATRAA